MSISADRVKVWRKRCKDRIITAMGGSCCVCKYSKCSSALALHHLNPSQKDISLGAIRANPKSWEKIIQELRKCVLVCHNCHSEIHSGIAVVPKDAPKFDESFADYKKLESEEDILTACPICGKLKPSYLKTCSRKCAASSKSVVDWDHIFFVDELYYPNKDLRNNHMERKPIIHVAEKLGCSDGAIHKRMKKSLKEASMTKDELDRLFHLYLIHKDKQSKPYRVTAYAGPGQLPEYRSLEQKSLIRELSEKTKDGNPCFEITEEGIQALHDFGRIKTI